RDVDPSPDELEIQAGAFERLRVGLQNRYRCGVVACRCLDRRGRSHPPQLAADAAGARSAVPLRERPTRLGAAADPGEELRCRELECRGVAWTAGELGIGTRGFELGLDLAPCLRARDAGLPDRDRKVEV